MNSLNALRQHARVVTMSDGHHIWLSWPYPFMVTSVLVLGGSLILEGVLLQYALEQSGPGAWSIVVIVSLWLIAVLVMIRHRWRAIRESSALRLSPTTLSVGLRTIPRNTIDDVRFVEKRTYSAVELVVAGETQSIVLHSPKQGPPLVSLIQGTD